MTDERDRGRDQRDEIDETIAPREERADPEDAAEQDFALRNVTMSNALPGSGQPAAGAVVGSGGALGMDPTTDEEEAPPRDV